MTWPGQKVRLLPGWYRLRHSHVSVHKSHFLNTFLVPFKSALLAIPTPFLFSFHRTQQSLFVKFLSLSCCFSMAQKTFIYQTFDFFFLFLWIALLSFEVPDSYPFLFSLGWHQCSSVAHPCPTLCNPMDRRTPGFPVHQQLLELAQTHVHGVGDAIQPSHPLLSPSPAAFNLSQHQSLFQQVSSLYQVAKVLEFQLQHQSFQWTARTDFL